MCGLIYLLNMRVKEDLPVIWHTISPLSKGWMRAAMELELNHIYKEIHFKTLGISQSVSGMVLDLRSTLITQTEWEMP